MNLNHFTKQGKALHCEVCEMIVEKWLEGSSDFVTNSICMVSPGTHFVNSQEFWPVHMHNQ